MATLFHDEDSEQNSRSYPQIAKEHRRIGLTIETFELRKQFPKDKGLWGLISSSRRGNEVAAIDKVNLTIEKVELFGMLDLDRAGKTPMIKLLSPTGGSGATLRTHCHHGQGPHARLWGYL